MAAAIPLAFGALTVFAGRGILVLLGSVMTIEALSVVVCTMMGLALGVDYSLFIVSRFREELAAAPRHGRRHGSHAAPQAERPCSPAPPCSRRSCSLHSCSRDRCCSRWRRHSSSSPRSAWRSPGSPFPLCWRCSASGSTWARSAGAATSAADSRVAAAADSALRRPALAAALIAVPLACSPHPPSPSTPALPGSASCPPRARLGRAPSDRPRRRPGLGGALRDRRRGPAAARSRPSIGWLCWSARSVASPTARGAGGDRPGSDRACRSAAARPRQETCVRRPRQLRPALRPRPRPAPRRRRRRPPAERPLARRAGSGLLGAGSERAGAGAGAARRRPRPRRGRRGAASEALGRLAPGSRPACSRTARSVECRPRPGSRTARPRFPVCETRRCDAPAASPANSNRPPASDPSLRADGAAAASARPDTRRRARQGAGACAKSPSSCTARSSSLAAGGTRLENGTRRLAGKRRRS